MKMKLSFSLGLLLAVGVKRCTAEEHSGQFMLTQYSDDQCSSQTSQVDISEKGYSVFALPENERTGYIWNDCIDYTDKPFNSVKFEVTGEDALRSSDNCRADVFRGRNCQGPILASQSIRSP